MKLEDCRKHYYEYSGKASDILRQLAFAGIALIWIFRVTVHGQAQIPEALSVPAVLFACGLAFDLLQYLFATVMWGGFGRYKELKNKTPRDQEFKAPRWINWPGNTFFFLKTISVLMAYIFLIHFLLSLILV